jgi:hypothetical protein
MRTIFLCMTVAVAFALLAVYSMAQEVITTPAPAPSTTNNAGVDVDAAVQAHANATANNWRYRWFNGRWWYWTPQNRWMWYSDDGHWTPFDANQAPLAIAESYDNPAYYGGYYYPAPGYWTGYYPGVAVGVRPYGNVNVGVGRRIGVDVWGPHGGVRVGRIWVGW